MNHFLLCDTEPSGRPLLLPGFVGFAAGVICLLFRKILVFHCSPWSCTWGWVPVGNVSALLFKVSNKPRPAQTGVEWDLWDLWDSCCQRKRTGWDAGAWHCSMLGWGMLSFLCCQNPHFQKPPHGGEPALTSRHWIILSGGALNIVYC